jgi:hypothetical protein
MDMKKPDKLNARLQRQYREWLEVPAQYQIDDPLRRLPRTIHQNVIEALAALNRAGHFPVEWTETGLVICGYS